MTNPLQVQLKADSNENLGSEGPKLFFHKQFYDRLEQHKTKEKRQDRKPDQFFELVAYLLVRVGVSQF